MKSRKSFLIRIDPTLYDELEAWAQQDFRSVNGQIEFVLKQAVARRRGRPDIVVPDESGADRPASRTSS